MTIFYGFVKPGDHFEVVLMPKSAYDNPTEPAYYIDTKDGAKPSEKRIINPNFRIKQEAPAPSPYGIAAVVIALLSRAFAL